MSTRPKAGTGEQNDQTNSDYEESVAKYLKTFRPELVEASDILKVAPEPESTMARRSVNLRKERMDTGTFRTRKA